MLDRYLEGHINRISPEAPVPAVAMEREWATPGGAGNVAASLGSGRDIKEACRIASAAAGNAVGHRGCYVVKAAEARGGVEGTITQGPRLGDCAAMAVSVV